MAKIFSSIKNLFSKKKADAPRDPIDDAIGIAITYEVEEDYENAAKWYREAAELGHALSQYSLGLFYLEGKGVEKNTILAFEWMKKAAEQGVVKAEAMLGAMYAKGVGVAKNKSQALSWLTKAAAHGDNEASEILVQLMSSGK